MKTTSTPPQSLGPRLKEPTLGKKTNEPEEITSGSKYEPISHLFFTLSFEADLRVFTFPSQSQILTAVVRLRLISQEFRRVKGKTMISCQEVYPSQEGLGWLSRTSM